MLLRRPATVTESSSPLEPADVPTPVPDDGELLVRVTVCGVCHTDLDIAEGRLAARHYPVILGHEVVGRVAAVGANATGAGFVQGDRVGIAWINWACGFCPACRAGTENLCPRFRSTGCDADGGYAEYVTVPAAFAYPIPPGLPDIDVAPLLCAGAIGWRSLRLTDLRDGEPLGLTGFGASATLVLQLTRRRFPNSAVFVFARNPDERALAVSLGAAWAGDTRDEPPEPPRAIIDTTPAWTPVVAALRCLAPGGRLVVNAIRKEHNDQQALLGLDYARDLWMERGLKSVANVTRADVRELLDMAVSFGLRSTVEEIPLDRANEALSRFRARGTGMTARVLRVSHDDA